MQLVGILLIMMAFYYLMAARKEMTFFFQWTVYVRVALAGFIAMLVFYQAANPILLLFALIELAGAVWTQLALRSLRITLASNAKVVNLTFRRPYRLSRKGQVIPPSRRIVPPNAPAR
jgi:hypothetical protein